MFCSLARLILWCPMMPYVERCLRFLLPGCDGVESSEDICRVKMRFFFLFRGVDSAVVARSSPDHTLTAGLGSPQGSGAHAPSALSARASGGPMIRGSRLLCLLPWIYPPLVLRLGRWEWSWWWWRHHRPPPRILSPAARPDGWASQAPAPEGQRRPDPGDPPKSAFPPRGRRWWRQPGRLRRLSSDKAAPPEQMWGATLFNWPIEGTAPPRPLRLSGTGQMTCRLRQERWVEQLAPLCIAQSFLLRSTAPAPSRWESPFPLRFFFPVLCEWRPLCVIFDLSLSHAHTRTLSLSPCLNSGGSEDVGDIDGTWQVRREAALGRT